MTTVVARHAPDCAIVTTHHLTCTCGATSGAVVAAKATLTDQLGAEVDRMRDAMEARVAADPTFLSFDDLTRKLVEATEQGRAITDPTILAALVASRARRAAPCEVCGCDGECRVMP